MKNSSKQNCPANKAQNARSRRSGLSNAAIPIFYASDVNYLPYLAVSLQSLKENANRNYIYEIYILHSGIAENEQQRVLNFGEERFSIKFVNVSERLEAVKSSLQLRDYYTGATYYRIFIANMFPDYDKALYLDSDTVILGDISRLYRYDLRDNLVGAVTDAVVNGHPVFREYAREVLGIEPKYYFNAGILVMNLKKFRSDDFYGQFRALLAEYKFCVAQDQDYLNVICKNKVKYLPNTWNAMPVSGEGRTAPMLVHYNLTAKPWHYADVPFAKYFWKYAQSNVYSDEIRRAFGEHTLAAKQRDDATEAKLVTLAQSEIERRDNFIKVRRRNELEQQFNFDVFESLLFSSEEEIYNLEDSRS